MKGFSLLPWFPDIYSENATYTCVKNMRNCIDQVNQLNRGA